MWELSSTGREEKEWLKIIDVRAQQLGRLAYFSTTQKTGDRS